MNSEIDYQAVAEGLQRELEQARLEILRLRFSRSVRLDGKAVGTFFSRNYLTIVAVAIVLSVIFNGLDFFKTLYGGKRDA